MPPNRVIRALTHGGPAALSVAARLASGVVLFIAIARAIGPSQFGVFASVLALATLTSLLTNLGLPMLLLTEGAGGGDKLWRLLSQCLWLKTLSAGLVTILSPLAFFYDIELGTVYCMLLLASIAEGYSDLYICARRAGERHASELGYSVFLALLNLVCVGIAILIDRTVVSLSLGFMLGRILGAAAMRSSTHREVGASTRSSSYLYKPLDILRRTRANFFELVTQTILIQVDTVLVATFAGPTQAGLYQAAIRLVHGISQAITVVANVTIPRASKDSDPRRKEGILRLARKMLTIAGLLLFGALFVFSNEIAHALFGKRYEGLDDVLAVAGMVVFVRFLAAAEGLRMIVLGLSRSRITGLILALIVLLPCALALVPTHGARGMMYAMAAAYLTIYATALLSRQFPRQTESRK